MYKTTAALVLLMGSAAMAAAVAIPNASFENGSGYWGAPEWSTAGDGGPVQEIVSSDVAGKHGNNFLHLAVEGGGDGSPPTETGYQFSQSLGNFEPNTVYTLTVALTHGYDWNPSDTMKAGLGFSTGVTPATVIASQLYSMRSDGSTGDYVPAGQFTDKTYVLTTGTSDAFLGEPIRVALVFEHGGQYFRGARFDDVRLDASPVPEPASIGILAAVTLLAMRRRRSA